MADATRSAVARATQKFAAYIGGLLLAPSPSSPSTLHGDTEKMQEGIKRLTRVLDRVRATLDDAENVKMVNELDRYWLGELQVVARDAEDVLDDFLYEASRLESHGKDALDAVVDKTEEAGLQVCYPGSPTPSHEVFAFLNGVEQRVEKINARYGAIIKEKEALCFSGQRHVETPIRQPTSCLKQESVILGRERDLQMVKEFLLSDAEPRIGSKVSVIVIVGMGGLGKTTLAQHIYNDDVISEHFHMKSWVCVSEGFDLVRLTEAMVQSLNLEASGVSELNPLQMKLKHKLSERRFLLVLDDVWEVKNLSSNWSTLTAPLRNRSAESKIIITTRSEKVSEMVRATSTHHLSFLQYEDCLKLFSQHAFEGQNPNLCPNLMVIGEKISMKCKGLPLVAKTLGGVLNSVDDEGMWDDILQSDVWNMNDENEIMPVLKLSYSHLPPHLKRCFRYCSVFPKAYEFDRDQLVWMWMAHGHIQAKANEGKLMEDVGREYFDDLLSRSLFQKSQKSQNFLMHDLIHDLARCVSGDECCGVEDDKSHLIPRNVQHFSIVSTGDPIRSTMLTEHIPEPGSLRSFLIISTSSELFDNVKLLNDLFTRMEHLRVLDLNGIRFSELLVYITRLKHLRYLGLRKDRVGQLPESVGSLYHLQTLDFGQSRVGRFFTRDLFDIFQTRDFGVPNDVRFLVEDSPDRLPNSISNLVNLRHLIYKGNNISVEYPVGIGKLTDLQTMPGFHVSPKYGRAKLQELKDMNNLKGHLAITGINNLTDVNEAKKAYLDKKKDLRSLYLIWEHLIDPSPMDNGVLENLKPSPKLENLCISGFKGQSHPSWLGDGSFSKLGMVRLDACRNWTSLPPLGQLLSLKWLSISAATGVEYIGHEFFSGGFPQLETLILEGMDSWKSWCGAQKGDCSRLLKLCVGGCEHLESLSVVNLDALQSLQVKECPQLRLSSGSLQLQQLPSLQKINIRSVYRVGRIGGDFFDPQSSNIWKLTAPCLKLENVGQPEMLYALGVFSHICELTVAGCANLTSLPLGNLNALEYVAISGCCRLMFSLASLQLLQLPRLQKIDVRDTCGAEYISICFSRWGTDSLKTRRLEIRNVEQALSVLGECSHVRQLTVTGCANLTSLPLSELDECSHIRQLTITGCANLASLPLGNLTALKYVEISGCRKLKFSSASLQLLQLPHLQMIVVRDICGAEYICGLFSRRGTESLKTSYLEMRNVERAEALSVLVP